MLTTAVDYDKDQLDAAVAAVGNQFPNDIAYIRYTMDEGLGASIRLWLLSRAA